LDTPQSRKRKLTEEVETHLIEEKWSARKRNPAKPNIGDLPKIEQTEGIVLVPEDTITLSTERLSRVVASLTNLSPIRNIYNVVTCTYQKIMDLPTPTFLPGFTEKSNPLPGISESFFSKLTEKKAIRLQVLIAIAHTKFTPNQKPVQSEEVLSLFSERVSELVSQMTDNNHEKLLELVKFLDIKTTKKRSSPKQLEKYLFDHIADHVEAILVYYAIACGFPSPIKEWNQLQHPFEVKWTYRKGSKHKMANCLERCLVFMIFPLSMTASDTIGDVTHNRAKSIWQEITNGFTTVLFEKQQKIGM